MVGLIIYYYFFLSSNSQSHFVRLITEILPYTLDSLIWSHPYIKFYFMLSKINNNCLLIPFLCYYIKLSKKVSFIWSLICSFFNGFPFFKNSILKEDILINHLNVINAKTKNNNKNHLQINLVIIFSFACFNQLS